MSRSLPLSALDGAVLRRRRHPLARLGLNLAVIYEADQRLGGTHLAAVQKIEDLSGSGYPGWQATESRRPLYINGSLKELWYQAIHKMGLQTRRDVDLSAGFTAVIAGRCDYIGADLALFEVDDATHTNSVVNVSLDFTGVGFELSANGGAKVAYSAAHNIRAGRDFYVTVAVTGAAACALRSRGNDLALTEGGAGGYLPASAELLTLGESDGGTVNFEGSIHGLWVASPALSATDRGTLEAYVAARLPDYGRDAALLNTPAVRVDCNEYAAPTLAQTGTLTITPTGAWVYGSDCSGRGAPIALKSAASGCHLSISGATWPLLADWCFGIRCKIGSLASGQYLMYSVSPANAVNGIAIYINATGTVQLALKDGAGIIVSTTSTLTVVVDQTYNFAIDINRTTQLGRLIVDGVIWTSASIAALGSLYPSDGLLKISGTGSTTLPLISATISSLSICGASVSVSNLRTLHDLSTGNHFNDAIAPLGPAHAWEVDPDRAVTKLAGTAALTLTAAATAGDKAPLGCGIPWLLLCSGADQAASVADADFTTAYKTGDFSIVMPYKTTSAAATIGLFGKMASAGAAGFRAFLTNAGKTLSVSAHDGVTVVADTCDATGYTDGKLAVAVLSCTAGVVTAMHYHQTGGLKVGAGVAAPTPRTNAVAFEVGSSTVDATDELIGSLAPPYVFPFGVTPTQVRSIVRELCRGDAMTYVPDS